MFAASWDFYILTYSYNLFDCNEDMNDYKWHYKEKGGLKVN